MPNTQETAEQYGHWYWVMPVPKSIFRFANKNSITKMGFVPILKKPSIVMWQAEHFPWWWQRRLRSITTAVSAHQAEHGNEASKVEQWLCWTQWNKPSVWAWLIAPMKMLSLGLVCPWFYHISSGWLSFWSLNKLGKHMWYPGLFPLTLVYVVS